MHDPMTVAFDFRYPWFQYRPWPKSAKTWDEVKNKRRRSPHWREGYRETFATLWHADPETDGSDDSCGWSRPKLTKQETEKIEKEMRWILDDLFEVVPEEDRTVRAKIGIGPIQGIFTIYERTAWFLWRKRVPAEWLTHIISLASNPMDSWIREFNGSPVDLYSIRRIPYFAARNMKGLMRPWWKHPRYHFWHWKLTIHPLQQLKRWLFSRCAGCGDRFTYGYSPHTYSWHGTGPRWFRGESSVYHSDCLPRTKATPADPKKTEYLVDDECQ